MKKRYITFRFYNGLCDYIKVAVICKDIEEMRHIASDVYSLDGVSYIRFNKSGRLQNDVKVISADFYLNNNWIEYIRK